jgi:hypothetical protein
MSSLLDFLNPIRRAPAEMPAEVSITAIRKPGQSHYDFARRGFSEVAAKHVAEDELKAQRPTLDELKAAAKAHVDAEAGAGDGVSAGQRGLHFPRTSNGDIDLVPLFVKLHYDELLALLYRQIEQKAEGQPPGISAADKRKRLAKLKAEILDLEREACGAAWAAHAEGAPLDIPAHTSPLAILGIADSGT